MPSSSPISTESGAALFNIGFYPLTASGLPNYYKCFRASDAVAPFSSDCTAISPATSTTVFTSGTDVVPDPVKITAGQQFEDAKVTVQRDQFEHKTQLSSKALKYLITGIEMMAEVSIAKISQDHIARIFDTVVNSNAVVVKDMAGQELYGNFLRIVPYDGDSLTTDTSRMIAMPNAAPVDISNTDLSYGLETQRNLKVTFYSLPFYVFDPDDPINNYQATSKSNKLRVVFGALPAEGAASADYL